MQGREENRRQQQTWSLKLEGLEDIDLIYLILLRPSDVWKKLY